MADKLFGARIPAEVYRRLKVLAAERDTTVSALVEEAVTDLLAKYAKQRRGGRKNG